jgi:hypothetical protein
MPIDAVVGRVLAVVQEKLNREPRIANRESGIANRK